MDLFLFDNTFLNSSFAPSKEINDHKKNEKPLVSKEFSDKDFELDIDYIIELRPKPNKVIEFFQTKAKNLNAEYFTR